MRPFLGRVPIRAFGFRSLGQVEFTDPWGGHHRVTGEPPPEPFAPFDPTLTKDQIARDERKLSYTRKIKAKEIECEVLKANLEAHKSHYFDREESGEAEYQGYSNAVDAYNDCINKIAALEEEMKAVSMDFGVDSDYEWPGEVPEPTIRPFTPESPYIPELEPPPVPSVDWEWPEEVPQPPEVVPEPEPPELIEQFPQTTASVDWRTAGCPAGTQRFVRGGMCVSSGLVSTAFTTPSTPTTSFTMGRRISLSPGLGVRALGIAK